RKARKSAAKARALETFRPRNAAGNGNGFDEPDAITARLDVVHAAREFRWDRFAGLGPVVAGAGAVAGTGRTVRGRRHIADRLTTRDPQPGTGDPTESACSARPNDFRVFVKRCPEAIHGKAGDGIGRVRPASADRCSAERAHRTCT